MTAPFGGIGVGPFGLFAMGFDYDTPLAEARGQLASSRRIGADGRPVQVDDGTGAFEAMPDTAQRVLLLLAQVLTQHQRQWDLLLNARSPEAV
jgi:hypothetical protein